MKRWMVLGFKKGEQVYIDQVNFTTKPVKGHLQNMVKTKGRNFSRQPRRKTADQ